MKPVFFLLLCHSFVMKGQTDTLTKRNITGQKQTPAIPLTRLETDTLNFKNTNPRMVNKPTYKREPETADVDLKNRGAGLLHATDKDTLNPKTDLPVKKNFGFARFKKIVPAGTISTGYDYGFLPYTVNTAAPSSAFKSEGRVSVNVFNIPLEATWFYSSQKNLIGLNNYFRISYDAGRYKDQLNSKLNSNMDAYKSQLGSLNAERQNLVQKMAYADYLSTLSVDKWPLDKPAYNKPAIPPTVDLHDTTGVAGSYSTPDTLRNTAYSAKADSVRDKAEYYNYKSDSVKAAYNQYKEKYGQINDSIKKTQRKIDEIESLMNGDRSAYANRIPYFNKIQNFLSGVKRFEVGLCYPGHSTFLANNIPVRGINMEYGKNNVYFAFTYGTTVSTLLYSPKNIDGFLQNVRNSYNYFDFNNVAEGRKILAVKFGAGTKEGNHVFVGFMLGKGQTSYISPTNEIPAFIGKESNVVLEADIKYKLAKNTVADLIIGKSSLKDEALSYDVIRGAVKEIFSNYRSNALLARINTKIPFTKTSLGFSFRYIDPFFKSFGVGFMRSDNLRYEVKLEQPLTKKVKYTALFRYEEDNLLQLMNYKNRFYSMNNTLSCKLTKGLMVRLSYTPLLRTLTSKDYNVTNKNSISTAVVTFAPRTRKTSFQFDMLYSYYIINTDTQQINFQNVAYNHQVKFKGGFKTGLNVSWFKNTLSDSLNNNIFLAVLDAGYVFKNGSSLTVAGKSAYKLNGQLYPGFIVKSNIKVYKSLFWENQVEKFIVGDLFNGYDLENLKHFPYCFSTRLILNF
jgi:hypothetical protein